MGPQQNRNSHMKFMAQPIEMKVFESKWLRLFCSALFWACPGQLLVYAICKEKSHKILEKKLPWWALPWKMSFVKNKNGISKKKWDLFHNFNMGGTSYPAGKRDLYDQGVQDRSRWVQETGNIVLVEIRVLRNEPPRPKKNITTQNLSFVSRRLSALQNPSDPL